MFFFERIHHGISSFFLYLIFSIFFYLSTKAGRSYLAADFRPGDFIVFGKETKGLPREILEQHAETAITIPMPANAVRSLNLSTSAGIVLYEALRQSGQII